MRLRSIYALVLRHGQWLFAGSLLIPTKHAAVHAVSASVVGQAAHLGAAVAKKLRDKTLSV